MVLGILAMVIVPQITVSTQDAKESTLTTNLVAMRNAIELYYHQHENVYPGYYDGVTALDANGLPTKSIAGTVVAAFTTQLTQFTNAKGIVAKVKDLDDEKYGPYLKASTLPTNPFNDLATVVCDIAETDITVKTSSGAAAWKFYVITGILMADDGGTGHDDL